MTAPALILILAAGVARAAPDGGTDARRAPDGGAWLDPNMVAAIVRSRAVPEVKACYERGLQSDRALAGRVVVRWTITAKGKVAGIAIEGDTAGSPPLTECVVRVVAGLSFPAPMGGAVDVSFPFVFQSEPDTGPGSPAGPSAADKGKSRATRGPARRDEAWEAANAWLDALKRNDGEALTRLTELPLTYKTIGLKSQCVSSSGDAAALKKWAQCLRKSKSLILSELNAGSDVRIERDRLPDKQLEALGKGIEGGEWVPAFLNGDGVAFGFRFLVTGAKGEPRRVKAFLVSASFDEG
jgi:hypothetical protein